MKTSFLPLLTKVIGSIIIGAPFLFGGLTHGWCDDESHGVLAGGVVHNIASDRKVEKIGGIMQPEPLDFYLKRLFEDLSKKIDHIDQRLQNIETAVLRTAAQPSAAPTDPSDKTRK